MIALITVMNEVGMALAAVAQRLVQMSWQGSLFIVAVALITFAWRRGPACFKYGLWCLVLVKLLLPLSFSLPSGAVNMLPEPPVVIASAPTVSFEIADPRFEWPMMSWLGLAWAGGALLMLMMGLVRFRTLRDILMRSSAPASKELAALIDTLSPKIGVRWAVPVRTTDAISGPVVIGPLRPIIFIPENLFARLEPDERATLLAHELIHIKRRDTLVAACEMFALAVHWFNPLAWLMMAAIRTQRELACDDRVVALFGDAADDYGSGLLKIARFQQGIKGSIFGMAALGEGGSTIGMRVRNILSHRRRPIAFLSIPALIMLAVAACVVLPNHARKEKTETKTETAASQNGLIIGNFDLTPRDVESIEQKYVQDFSKRVVEAIQAFLNSSPAPSAFNQEQRLWFDDKTLQLTVVASEENMKQVRKYLASLPELKANQPKPKMGLFERWFGSSEKKTSEAPGGVLVTPVTISSDREVPISEFMHLLSSACNNNFEYRIASGADVPVMANFKNQPLRVVLDTVLGAKGIMWSINDKNVITIEQKTEIRIFKLTQAQQPQVRALLDSGVMQEKVWGQKTPPAPFAKIELDERANLLKAIGSKKHIEAAASLLKSIPASATPDLDTRIYNIAPENAERIKALVTKELDLMPNPAPGERKIFIERNQLVLRDTPANLNKIESLLLEKKFIHKLEEEKSDRDQMAGLGPVNSMEFLELNHNASGGETVMEGNVRIETRDYIMSADRVENSRANKKITLRGNARIETRIPNAQGERGVTTGDVIVLEYGKPGFSAHMAPGSTNQSTYRVIKAAPGQPEPMSSAEVESAYKKAIELQKAGKTKQAEAAFKALIEANRQDPLAWDAFERLAEIKRQTGDTVQALHYYQQIRDIYPEYPNIQRVREAISQIEAKSGKKASTAIDLKTGALSIDQARMSMDNKITKPDGSIVGSGHVVLDFPALELRGDSMFYESATKKLTLTGHAAVKEKTGVKRSVFTGDIITVELKSPVKIRAGQGTYLSIHDADTSRSL